MAHKVPAAQSISHYLIPHCRIQVKIVGKQKKNVAKESKREQKAVLLFSMAHQNKTPSAATV